jgi:hypothetical protein
MCNKCSSLNIRKNKKNFLCLECDYYQGTIKKELFLLQEFSHLNIENQKKYYNNIMEKIQKENTKKNFLRFRYFLI